MESILRLRDLEIERCRFWTRGWDVVNGMLVGGKKEVEILTSTVQNLTDKLMAAEKAQSEQASALAELKDELEVRPVE